MKKKIKISGISSGLIEYLGSSYEYLGEGLELTRKMKSILGKKESELTDEEKQMLKRSSELVILIETTQALEGIKR